MPDDRRRPACEAGSEVERVTRIELAFSAWEADVLPLNYTRIDARRPRTKALVNGHSAITELAPPVTTMTPA